MQLTTAIRGDAMRLPLGGGTVNLIVTSPPYFAMRSYRDGGEHYDGQVGSESTPALFLDALDKAMAEMWRVLKPSGSVFINLGDKYAGKSLLGLPWRFANRQTDAGWILRAEIVWSKPNGLPESVTDRVRRSHEQWFHFVKEPRYFSAVDEVREPHARDWTKGAGGSHARDGINPNAEHARPHPRGRLPGSVWTIPLEPLKVPARLNVDHFAAFPQEWPRKLISAWCPEKGIVLDPFGGTGTVAGVARKLGRIGISIDLSADYTRLAHWRIFQSGHFDKTVKRTTQDKQQTLL